MRPGFLGRIYCHVQFKYPGSSLAVQVKMGESHPSLPQLPTPDQLQRICNKGHYVLNMKRPREVHTRLVRVTYVQQSGDGREVGGRKREKRQQNNQKTGKSREKRNRQRQPLECQASCHWGRRGPRASSIRDERIGGGVNKHRANLA